MIAFVLMTAWGLAGADEAALRFDAAVTLPVGARPRDVAIADVNGDGTLDIIVANQGSGDVSVLLGRGDRTFAPAVHHAAGPAPVALAVGDLDGDGALDVVVTNFKDHTISMLLNDGHAAFAAPVTMEAGRGPQGVVLADLDRNGVLDIAVTNREGRAVSLYLNPGGRAVAPKTLATGARPTGIDAGDLDRDGHLDLAVANTYGDDISVLGGDGHGGFPRRREEDAGKWVSDVVLVDLDHDGDLDLGAATLSTGRYASVIINRGAGSYEPNRRYPVGRRSNSIVAGDFDLDGAPDLAISNEQPRSVAILRNRGDGTFGRRPVVLPTAGDAPRAVATADLDHDGDLDLVTADFLSDGVSILWNQRLRATCPADVDRNGSVDRDDLAALIAAWARDDVTACDLDNDCTVDMADVMVLMQQWGRCRVPLRVGFAY